MLGNHELSQVGFLVLTFRHENVCEFVNIQGKPTKFK